MCIFSCSVIVLAVLASLWAVETIYS